MDPRVLQYLMGHKHIMTTMEVYNHVSTQRVQLELERVAGVQRLAQ